MTINFPSYIFRVHTLILSASFFIHFVVELLTVVWIEKGEYCFYGPFLRNWYKRTKKYEKKIQTSEDNTVYDLRYETKFDNRVKDKNNFSIKRNIAFLF